MDRLSPLSPPKTRAPARARAAATATTRARDLATPPPARAAARAPICARGSAIALATAVALLATACDDTTTTGGAPPGRVVAVQANATEDPAERFCDVRPEPAPALTLPELAEGDAAPSVRGRRWLNVWATWCRPCVEEMPLLTRWKDRLAEDGVDVELVFLSADSTPEPVAAFLEEHEEIESTVRIADPETLPAWVTEVGLDEGATLPIHVLTDAQGRVRCARTGSIAETDYAAVRSVLR